MSKLIITCLCRLNFEIWGASLNVQTNCRIMGAVPNKDCKGLFRHFVKRK